MLTKRERILRTLRSAEVDRVAVSPFIWINYVNWFCGSRFSNRDEDLDEKLAQVYLHFDFDIMHRTCTIWDMFAVQYLDAKNWRVTVDDIAVTPQNRRVVTVIKTPEAELTEVKEFQKITEYDELSAETEFFIKNEEDWRQFLKFQPSVPRYDCSRIRRAKDIIGADGVTAPWIAGVFNTVSRLRGLDRLLTDPYTDPGLYEAMMSYVAERQKQAAVQLVEAGADIVTYEGNIANGTMVGPKYFREHILKYEKDVIAAIRERGAHVLYHNCGDSNQMFGVYNETGFDVLESLTEKPFGDTDIDHALQILREDITLIGNIDQVEFLKTASREEIRSKVRNLLGKMRRRGRFILGTSDYLSEGTPQENVKALREAVQDFGRWGHA